MELDPSIMQAVEQLGYRVTVGDVSTKAGLNISLAEKGLLVLAADAGGHLQVAESGEIVYLFPQDFRSILRNKFFWLQLQEWWEKVWRVLFYLIRISFGILLLVSIVLIFVSIFIILTASNSGRDNDNNSSRSSNSSGVVFIPYHWFGSDWFWFLYWDYDRPRSERRQSVATSKENQMNFLEAVFSFLFGDGNPNANLEERRWQAIATVIRNHQGAVVAEQISPYLDEVGQGYTQEYEEYMLPALTRFNGRPEVSPDGQIVYHFPDLQSTANQQNPQSVSAYLREKLWRFSEANSGQLFLAGGLGTLNIIGAFILRHLLLGGTAAKLGGLVAFVQSIFWLLLGYGIAFLTVPLIRYFWINFQNSRIEKRNLDRLKRADNLNKLSPQLQQKIDYARQFAAEKVIGTNDLAYTTEKDVVQQEIEQADKIDAEWERRLNQSDSQPNSQ